MSERNGQKKERWSKQGLLKLVNDWFAMPITAWGDAREVIYSILIASLLINLLALAFPLTLLQIYDRIIPNQAVTTLVVLCLGVLLALILSAILRVARSYIGSWADAKFEHIVGTKAFGCLLNSAIESYEAEGSGRHLKRIGALNQLRNFYAGQAIISIIDLPFVIIFLLLIGYIGLWIVLIPIVIICLYVFSTWKNSSAMVKILKERQEHDDRRLNFIVETIVKIHTIKANTMEAQMLRRYERLQKSSSSYDYNVTQRSAFMLTNSMSLSQLAIVCVVAFGSVMVFEGNLTVGALAACTLLVGRTLQPVNSLISLWSRLQLIRIARSEFEKVLQMEPECKPDLPILKKVQGDIKFENISFRYKEESPFKLENFSLHIPAKTSVSISGEGLSGKSTLLWLVMGMIKPQSGQVIVDNQDINKVNLDSLRSHIGYMPQQAVLFQGTLLENLTMFDEQYTDEAYEAAERVGLAEIVRSFPEGYDLKLGHQATDSIAIGIKQRIAIARALVRKPPIILFDEANNALDMSGDKKITELLQELQGLHTMVIISHRPSVLALADHHYTLQWGKLRMVS